jgi:hypothetical protein
MKLLITVTTFVTMAFLMACASKSTSSTTPDPAPVSTETPATMKSAQVEKVEKKTPVKKEMHSTTPAKTDSSAVGTAEVNCTAGTDERKLAIQVKETGCELQYTKSGETKVIATQISGSEKCEEVMTQVKERLVGAQFDCK